MTWINGPCAESRRGSDRWLVAFALTYRNIALLGSYMASSFVASSDGQSGTLISEAAHALSQTASLTQPHATG